jgi:hypothetical protein
MFFFPILASKKGKNLSLPGWLLPLFASINWQRVAENRKKLQTLEWFIKAILTHFFKNRFAQICL